jgi:arylsulfatase A-like enzyme
MMGLVLFASAPDRSHALVRRTGRCTLSWRALLAAACALGALPGCGERHPPDVVLITVDTLRADHLGAYVAGTDTPRLDAFARDATVFERCAAPMPLTRPSHFSIFTSLYPREHGVLNNAMALPGETVTLTERLAGHGYRTGGFVGVELLGPGSGADQGFERFDFPQPKRERRAEEVVSRALTWVDELPTDEPFFLWVHLFDPHIPYGAPASFRAPRPGDAVELTLPDLVRIARQHDGDVPATTLEDAKRLYRGEVAYVDHWIGALLDGLRTRRSLDRTFVALTADHGECFENGVFFDHADCLWEPGIHVPLIVRYPPLLPSGVRIAEQVSLIDLMPTALRAAGIEPPAAGSGEGLETVRGAEDRQVLVQYPFYQPLAAKMRPKRREALRSVAGEPVVRVLVDVEKVGVVGREWKYLRTGDNAELYAMTPSPDERHDVAAREPAAAAQMKQALERQLQQHPLRLLSVPEINERLLESLKALGYL